MSGPALVLGMVDTNTGQRHLISVEIVALHRRSGRYPALCGTVVEAMRDAVNMRHTEKCRKCLVRAEGRHLWLVRLPLAALLTKVRDRWRNKG